MMNGDLEKYKTVFEMSVQAETMYSPFTPDKQYKADQLVSVARRNDILDLSKVMGETKHQYEQFEKTIKSQKLEIAALTK